MATKCWPFGFVLAGLLGSFWCSTRPSADKGTEYNLCTEFSYPESALRAQSTSLTSLHDQHYNQCLFLPKAELNAKTNPYGHHCVAVWVRSVVQLDSVEKNLIYSKVVTFTHPSLRFAPSPLAGLSFPLHPPDKLRPLGRAALQPLLASRN